MAPGSPREVAFGALALASALAVLLITLAAWLASKSRKTRSRKPPRRSFDHGKRLAALKGVRTLEGASAALRASSVGEVVSLSGAGDRVAVTVRRKRNQPCVQAAGYLSGLFEAAWAHEVLVTHPACAGEKGGDCHFTIQRAPIGSGLPREGASIPGSQGGPRRSLRARSGGA